VHAGELIAKTDTSVLIFKDFGQKRIVGALLAARAALWW
jgi:hypothetical protein